MEREETVKAEIIWTLHTVQHHHSYKSNEGIQAVFKTMFPDSEIAKRFTCGEKKTAYLCCFGLAPHFKSLLESRVKQEQFVLCFDESLNKVTKNEQLDLHVRFWDTNCVSTRYLGSQFLGHTNAEALLESVCEDLERMNLSNLQQVSMDGPSVNWKLFDMLQDKVEKDTGNKFLNIGSCGLHVIHGALKDGFFKSDNGVHNFLSSLYWLFKDSPARREDFSKLTGSNTFPLMFCKHRWVENVPVAERALEMFDNVKMFVKAVQDKKVKDPGTKSFQTVQEGCQNVLLYANIHMFLTVSKLLTPFLTMYQAERPLLPFMSDDLSYLLKSLLQSVIKADVLKEIDTPLKLIKLDVRDKKLWKEVSAVDLGFSAENEVKRLHSKKKISDRQLIELRQGHREALLRVVEKLQNKSPLSYTLVRNMKCLDPRQMVLDKSGCVAKMKRLLKCLVDSKKIIESNCDDVIREYQEFLDQEVPMAEASFSEFNPKLDTQRVDVFLHDHLAHKAKKLWRVVKSLLILSHGQASVERGFSVNKEVATDNLQERSFVAQRIVLDHLSAVGGISGVNLTKPLVLAVGSARQKYMAHLDDVKRQKESHKQAQKRKSTMDQLEELKMKKRRIEQNIAGLYKSSEEFSERAEATGDITYVARANSLRRSAKEKSNSITDIDREIEEILKNLKN